MIVSEPAVDQASILLVDDRQENLLSLSAVLEPLGENIVLARSGEAALRQLLKQEFALILMDAEMPSMSGFETAEFIRAREKTSHIPIIFVTAHGTERKHMSRSYSVGAVDYIPKPFDPEVLRSKVRVFVELYKKNEQIKQQAELLHQIELADADRKQKELQEELERQHMRILNEELERRVEERTSELLAANSEMEAFCYSVSHDLRAPLRAIMATSRMMLEDVGEQIRDDQRKHLERQAAAAKRLSELIDDLLLLSRLGRSDMIRDEVSISALAEQAKKEVMARGWHQDLTCSIAPELTCSGDSRLLKILVMNLLENACKYSPNGGEILVGKCTNVDKEIFFVQDHGVGFDMQYASKIFRPFERLVRDEEYEGTGIGLAICRRIVQRHNGQIWCESAPGAGTTIYFTLA